MCTHLMMSSSGWNCANVLMYVAAMRELRGLCTFVSNQHTTPNCLTIKLDPKLWLPVPAPQYNGLCKLEIASHLLLKHPSQVA